MERFRMATWVLGFYERNVANKIVKVVKITALTGVERDLKATQEKERIKSNYPDPKPMIDARILSSDTLSDQIVELLDGVNI